MTRIAVLLCCIGCTLDYSELAARGPGDAGDGPTTVPITAPGTGSMTGGDGSSTDSAGPVEQRTQDGGVEDLAGGTGGVRADGATGTEDRPATSDASSPMGGEGGGSGSGGGVGRGAGIGIGTIVIVVIGYFMGVSPSTLLSFLNGDDPQAVTTQNPAGPPTAASNDPQVDFVRAILGSTEDVWTAVLPASGARYVAPKLVLFSDAVDSACGFESAAVGPFYCPPDRKVYLDLSFLRELARRFGAPGDFAQAYVIGHEVGHHVQNLLGISARVEAQRAGAGRVQANQVSVETELQADCLAGVWAYHANQTHHVLEQGDVDGALRAATAIGDDTLERRAGDRVVPDSFTHGSSAQRVHWLRTGLDRGRVADCDTFSSGP